MPRPKIHLVANAHLDPVWLWDWEEGAAEALSTFRTAASLCEEFEGFVFNHNEAVLYRWVEEHEPALFRRIQRLVRAGKWHIMGGWYLQPDCNMPSGQSFIRQILLGKRYFKKKFGVDIKTASNLDPFGHSRGLVQILAKSGFDSYVFCRPGQNERPLPADDFIWVGFDGSEVIASRISAHYNSPGGAAPKKVLDWIAANPGRDLSLLLWGVGNHGGGPTRQDLAELRRLMDERKDVLILHSTLEAYFKDLRRKRGSLPRHAGDLNPWAVGCYTTMARLKLDHRRLENDLLVAEKMAAAAHFQGLTSYPQAELEEARRDLAFSQFHDILPGSSIPAAEESSLRRFRDLDGSFELASSEEGSRVSGITAGPSDGSEVVAQKWTAVVSVKDDLALTCINEGVHGSDFLNGEARLSLLRSPAYSADPVLSGPMVSQDRYIPRIDQGERLFRFWLKGGKRPDVDHGRGPGRRPHRVLRKGPSPFRARRCLEQKRQGHRPHPLPELPRWLIKATTLRLSPSSRPTGRRPPECRRLWTGAASRSPLFLRAFSKKAYSFPLAEG